MCAIFGFVNIGNKVTKSQLESLMRGISIASEVRGTDATGYGYVSNGNFVIEKSPVPARDIEIKINEDTRCMIGHTRWKTQGSEEKNYNNHPFVSEKKDFIMAHNGMIHNDKQLKKEYKLAITHIETDSYVAVQFIDKLGGLNFDNLKKVSEVLSGSFVLTFLNSQNEMYIVKYNNPIWFVYFKEYDLYVYTSTKDIFDNGIIGTEFENADYEKICIEDFDIVKIEPNGNIVFDQFENQEDYFDYDDDWYYYDEDEDEVMEEVLQNAWFYGISQDDIYDLMDFGYSAYDIIDAMLDGYIQELKKTIREIKFEF